MVLPSNVTVLLNIMVFQVSCHSIIKKFCIPLKVPLYVNSYLKLQVGIVATTSIIFPLVISTFNTFYASRLVLSGKPASMFTQIMASWPSLSHRNFINKPNSIWYFIQSSYLHTGIGSINSLTPSINGIPPSPKNQLCSQLH